MGMAPKTPCCVNCGKSTVEGIFFQTDDGKKVTIPLCASCQSNRENLKSVIGVTHPLEEKGNPFWNNVISELDGPRLGVFLQAERAVYAFLA